MSSLSHQKYTDIPQDVSSSVFIHYIRITCYILDVLIPKLLHNKINFVEKKQTYQQMLPVKTIQ